MTGLGNVHPSYFRQVHRARYVGWCTTCGQRIKVGDMILHSGGAYRHELCPRHQEVRAQAVGGEIVRLVATPDDTVRVEVMCAGEDRPEGDEEFRLLVELPSAMFRRLQFDFGY